MRYGIWRRRQIRSVKWSDWCPGKSEIVEAHYKVLRFSELGTNVEKEINLGVRRVEDLASEIFTRVRSLGTSSWRQKSDGLRRRVEWAVRQSGAYFR